MKEKESTKKIKKTSESGKWLGPFLLLLLLAIIGFFVFLHFSPPDKKNIEMMKKDGDKIGIYDLTEKEVDKIDWSKGAEFARSGENNKQYRLYGEGKSFFKRLIGKPTIYQIYSTLDPHEIRGKDIEFDGFANKKNVKILATKDFTKHDFFGEESFSI